MALEDLKTPEARIAEAEYRIALCEARKLNYLDLSYLYLETIPAQVRKLVWLETLDLGGNKLVELPEWIGEFSRLTGLSLYDNSLTTLPVAILKLNNLEMLYLGENSLTELPDAIGDLPKLLHLKIENNRLRSLPSTLRKLKSLQFLNVQGNEDLRLPAEITTGRGQARKVLDFYFRVQALDTESGAQALNEFKLILVGRGLVGKTTLVHKLVTDEFREFQRTPGINITTWPVTIDGDDVRAHAWDFGGQEIMHGTHRFFMTERALYLIFVSGREGTEDHDADYWLSLVRSFAGNTPVIVLLNKWDDYHFELNRELLREKYGKDLVFLETDSKTGTGINELRNKICQLAGDLPGLKAAWPAEWRRVKEELPEQENSWLTFDDFREFCRQRGVVKAKDQEALAESLHDLGLMLSFHREEALRDFGVLNPQWITQGIYQILNSEPLRKAQGKFAAAKFAVELPTAEYPPAVHPYLLALMRKFRLCHPLDDKGDKYLIPELLSKQEPTLEAEFPRDQCLGFAYRYEAVLPEGLLPRFIVETYVHREPTLAWRTGVVLERANCRALVRGDVQGRTVTIRVAGMGQGRRELLGIIREHFERIHRSFEKLPVTELVPIPQYPDTVVPYNDLLDYEAAGDDEYKVVIDRRPVKFSVTTLLDGVDIPGVRRPADRTVPFHREFLRDRDSVSLFISYSHKDERYRDELRGALTAYERRGEVTSWDDTCIMPGQKWEHEIQDKLERADIVILLLSNDFIRSEYCYSKEMKRALERDAAGVNAIVPIVVRACAFEKLELGKLQAILPLGKPIKEHKDRDRAWFEVTSKLDPVIDSLKNSRQEIIGRYFI